MDFTDIRDVNELFEPFYPFVAGEILEAYGRAEGEALEIGPYGPGISIALARRVPGLRFVVADDDPQVLDYFREKVAASGLGERICVHAADKYRLPFPEGRFDLTYFRGALFFWDEEPRILQEMVRVLRPGGMALAGGGFGRDAPDALIERYLQQSHELNRRLGKRVLGEKELEALLARAGLSRQVAAVSRAHGLWVTLRKAPAGSPA